jgi:hypothetical protein
MNISIFSSFQKIDLHCLSDMPLSYFMLTRVPGLGHRTLKEAQRALLFLLAFFNIIHVVPGLVNAKKDSTWID